MIERNDLYDYGYYIYQNSDYFKFSLDSILLAEFVKYKKNASVLDLCTGNAPVPMILWSKEKSLNIDCIEIQKEIFELGKKSIEENKMNSINIILGDIKKIKLDKKYDIVTCNPPYFKVDEKAKLNVNEIKRIQRHEIKLSLEDAIKIGCKYLKDDGVFYIVYRANRIVDLIKELDKQKLGIRKIYFIYTKNNEAELVLIEASKCKKTDPKIKSIKVARNTTYKNIFEEV